MIEFYRSNLEEIVFGSSALDPTSRVLCLAATAASVNCMEAVEASIDIALNTTIATHSELYEALLQTYLFAGFPAALESLSVLHKYLKNNDIKEYNSSYDTHEYLTRGENLCRSVYTNVYEKMRAKFRKISPELDHWMIIEGYGKTLSRSGLPNVTRELISASSLAALGWENQFYSHVRGAMNLGATPNQCRALLPGIAILSSEARHGKAQIILETVLDTLQ